MNVALSPGPVKRLPELWEATASGYIKTSAEEAGVLRECVQHEKSYQVPRERERERERGQAAGTPQYHELQAAGGQAHQGGH